MTLMSKTPPGDITLGALLTRLADAPTLPLVFEYGDRRVRPGYHVTEVKAGQFAALDCGANPEAWAELFVQLWDVDDGGRTHMTAAKFAAIVTKVSRHVELDQDARLTFEVSDGVSPMQLYCAGEPVRQDGVLRVVLLPRAASCKPRDRWLAQQAEATGSDCCGSAALSACCG